MQEYTKLEGMDGVPGMNKPKGNHKYDQILYWARTYRTAEL